MTFTIGQFTQSLQTDQRPLKLLRRETTPAWHHEGHHDLAYRHDPALYALLALGHGVTMSQRARILFQILQASRQQIDAETQLILNQVTAFLLTILPAEQTLTVFLALRRVRANHKHTRRAILRYLLNHPDVEGLAHHRRPALVDCLEHAIGRDVARACAKFAQTGADETYLRRHLLRFAVDTAKARRVVRFLYHQIPLVQTAPPTTPYTLEHAFYWEWFDPRPDLPSTVTATNRGDIAATLVHLYRGGVSTQLQTALQQAITQEAAQLPRFEGKIGLVLDTSASMQGYGEREFCILAQAVAFQLVLARCCREVVLQNVGGTGLLPQPIGATDLASAVVEVLAHQPDLVVVISDGYENVQAGDLARVVATLPHIGLNIPIAFCHSKFTHKDDLTLRRPALNLPQFEFWHQAEFQTIMVSLFALAQGQPGLRQFLAQQLQRITQELPPWIYDN